MAIRHLLVLPICAIGRNERPDVNTRKSARKLLESGSIGRGDAAIMDGKGAPCRTVKKSFAVVRLSSEEKSLWRIANSVWSEVNWVSLFPLYAISHTLLSPTRYASRVLKRCWWGL